MSRIKKYNQILGLSRAVSAEELKKIYREKAKTLHPDRNNDPKSHEQFVLLGEAYEFYFQLLKQEEEKKREAFYNSKKYPERYYTEKWNVEKRMAARRRAAEAAKMKYKKFEEQGYHKRLDRLFFLMDIVRFILAIALLIALPVFLFLQDQFRGLIMALFVQLITYRLWSRALKRFLNLN